jgi:transposase
VTDEQWDGLQSLLPERAWRPGGRGRPPSCDVRYIINGMMFLNKTGCQWRMIPQEFEAIEEFSHTSLKKTG